MIVIITITVTIFLRSRSRSRKNHDMNTITILMAIQSRIWFRSRYDNGHEHEHDHDFYDDKITIKIRSWSGYFSYYAYLDANYQNQKFKNDAQPAVILYDLMKWVILGQLSVLTHAEGLQEKMCLRQMFSDLVVAEICALDAELCQHPEAIVFRCVNWRT